MKQTATQFEFAAKPKVTAVKPKFREETRFDGSNLMNDPRVVRGNTYAAIVENRNDVQPPPPRRQPKEAPRRRERVTLCRYRSPTSTPASKCRRRAQSGEGSIAQCRRRPSWRR